MEGAPGALKKVTFLKCSVGEVNQIRARRNVPLSCHLTAERSSVVAAVQTAVLMIQQLMERAPSERGFLYSCQA